MKRLEGLLLFGVIAFLIAIPFSAMGANLERVNKSAGLGLAGGQITGDSLAFGHGFSNIHSAAVSFLPSIPACPFSGAGAPTPSWWIHPPERQPWYASPPLIRVIPKQA